MSDIERRVAKSVLATNSVTGTAGKGLTLAGAGAITLSLLATIIPFVGVLGLGVIFLVLGLFMWE